MDAVDMIEGWCKGVRAEVERRLLAGTFSDGRYKLVEGRAGARAWADEAEAEKLLKSFRLKQDEMYDFTLISPTAAEKVLAATSPKRWAKAQALIRRSDGKPSVAPAADKRPALVRTPVADDFDALPPEVETIKPTMVVQSTPSTRNTQLAGEFADPASASTEPTPEQIAQIEAGIAAHRAALAEPVVDEDEAVDDLV
jgi:hypothetical protein